MRLFFDASMTELKDAIDEKKRQAREFRRRWIPSVKILLATAADVVGDWVFYIRTKDADEELDNYEGLLYFFCLVSSVLACFTVASIVMTNCTGCMATENGFKLSLLSALNWTLGMEIFFEDIPQMVLTTLVLVQRNGGVWSPVAVFNFTTSAFNFSFSVLDMMMPFEEKEYKNPGGMSESEYKEKIMTQQWSQVDDDDLRNKMTEQGDTPGMHGSTPTTRWTRTPDAHADRIRLHQQWARQDITQWEPQAFDNSMI